MLKSLRSNIVKYFLLILFLAFFGSINFFTHIHIVDGISIVHSHPGLPSHRHTQGGFQVIHLLNNLIAAGIVLFYAVKSDPALTGYTPVSIASNDGKNTDHCRINPLRGPPAAISI